VPAGPAATPDLSVTATCSADRTASFTITNNGGNMATPDQAIIRDLNGAVVHTESFRLDAGQSITISVANMSGKVTLETVDFQLSAETTCFYPPELSVTATCSANHLPVFTITNARPTDGPMAAPQAYEIRDSQGTVIDSGTFQLGLNQTSVDIPVPAGNNPYETYSFTSTGASGDLSVQGHRCAEPPQLSVSSQCDYPIAFTITNTGGDMVLEQAYTIVSNGTPVTSGTLNLAAGASTTVTLDGLDPYAGYTFSTTGFAGNHSLTQDCERPALEITSQCDYPIAFTITNTGGDMLLEQAYTIVSNGTPVTSGTLNLAAGTSTTVTLDGLDPYAGYTFSTTGFAGNHSLTQDCARPALNPTTQCADIVTFTVTNDGGKMLTTQPYSVVDPNGIEVVAGSFDLDANASVTIPVPDANPYHTYTLKTDGFAGTLDFAHLCEAPVLYVTTTCESPARFTITNTGGDMLVPHTYRLFSDGRDVTPAGNEFMLLKGQSLRVDEPGVDMARGLRFETSDYGITAEHRFSCEPFVMLAALPTLTPTPALTPAPGLPSPSGFGGFTGGELELDWNAAPVCGYGCPTFRIYHTNEPDNWNIFRLDGADQETRQSFRRNLSFGEGPDVRDMSPSLSPNEQWIIFSSNRDGNWELYVASTSGDPASVRRVTFNTIAIDTDPVWGPNNFVAFETTRNGQWDIYAIDMSTGLEYRLTDDSGNDINPFWSPDGSRLLFQSDRPDENGERKWQIYELSLGSWTITRLSDGESIDVDPQYSNDGRHIVYRSYAEDGANSVLMIMDADGRNKRAITSPAEDATNPVWSPRDRYIAYQSDLDGDLDIYVYEVATGETRQLTDNDIPDYAPTWDCFEERVIFTSDIGGNPDIYDAEVQPITAGPIAVDEDARQLTFEPFDDIYPQGFPPEENASREGQTVRGSFGQQTVFLQPDVSLTRIDLSLNRERREDWLSIDGCAGR